MRLLTALTIVTLAFIAAAPAQEARAPAQQAQKGSEWQSVITRQIEAFRGADAAGALSCAGQQFRNRFTENPKEFYEFIAANEDYSPIVKSRSHSYGEFQLTEDQGTVLQVVFITSADQRVYKALYEMTREAGGWKIQGVTPLIAESIAT